MKIAIIFTIYRSLRQATRSLPMRGIESAPSLPKRPGGLGSIDNLPELVEAPEKLKNMIELPSALVYN